MDVLEIYRSLEPDLAAVESELQERLACGDESLRLAGRHLLESGGKRLRPVFVLLSGSFGRSARTELIRAAAGLELIHMATLVHDDVVDNADIRRGRPTVRAQYGNQLAMYVGDYMFAQALACLTDLEDERLHHIVSRALERMCLGEIEQVDDLFFTGQPLSRYLRRIRRKTAFLFEMSCALGALAARAGNRRTAALRRYGYCTGMAFQITDDILDFTASESSLGKPVGNDLRQGNITAPVLYALRNPAAGAELAALISERQSDGDVRRAIALVRESGGLEAARALADRYLARARNALSPLPLTDARASLEAIALFVADRDR